MRAAARALLAALFAAALLAAAAAAAEGDDLVVRTDDKVYLRDSLEPLVGKIVYQNKKELSIRIKGGITRIVQMSNVRRVLRRQNAQEAFDRRFEKVGKAPDAARYYALARAALRLEAVKMIDNAVKALEAGRKHEAKHVATRLLLGQLYLKRGETESARKEALAVVAAHPEDPSGHVLLGIALGRQGDVKKAEQAVEKALAYKPSEGDRIGVARILAEIGSLKRAKEVIDQVLKDSPHNAGAQLVAGLVALRGADLVQAEKLLTDARDKLKDQSEPHLALAALLYLKGDLKTALQEVNEGLNYGGRARCHALKALIELRDGKPDRAAKSVDAAMRASPNLARAAAAKAVVDLAAGKSEDDALRALEGPLEKAGSRCRDAYVHYLQSHLLYRKPYYANPLSAFNTAAHFTPAAANPSWIDPYLAAGAAALAARKYPDAARAYRAAVRVDEKSAAAHAGLGLACLGQVGRGEDADLELRRALAIDGRNLEAHLGLGYLANRRKSEIAAIKYFERAAGLSGGSRYAARALSLLRAGRGENVDLYAFDGPGLPTGWSKDQRYGILAEAKGGRVVLSGKQKQVGGRNTRFYLRQDARKLVRLEMDVETAPTGGLVAGMFVAGSRGFLELGLFESGKLCWRMKSKSGYSVPADIMDWPAGAGGKPGRVRLAVEVLSANRGAFRLYVGGRAVKDVTVDTLANVQGYQVGAFCRAQLGEEVRVELDNATLVTRKAKGDGK